ncbi:MAG TPA: hypothetical protein VGE46_02155 [Bdellovibrio sp.]
MNIKNKFFVIILFLISAAVAATLLRQQSASEDTTSAMRPPSESINEVENVPASTNAEISTPPIVQPTVIAGIVRAAPPSPPTASNAATDQALPESPFLLPGTATPEIPTSQMQSHEESDPAEASFSSLSWLQFSVGTTSLSQAQEDRVYNETRTVTNPLSLLISLGASLSQTIGAEFSWAQKIVSGASKNNNIPNSAFSAGLTWQAKALQSSSYFLRWGLGLSVDEAAYISGAPTESRLANYSRTALYGSAQYTQALTNLWYLDVKLMLTLSPVKPDSFSEYTENGWLLRVTPQYEFTKNLRVGISFEYKNRERQLGIVNHLGQADSSSVNLREFQTALTLQYSF